ncbi:glycosyltransferase family 4 protein [Algoriphagus machipongonensis]|uniref:Glycosyl transferase n=1 Tax=Algoriphagus machipongonensis TaxID=388413 RepID=A3HRR4_9BACT|nr:glycosyltransferase family 4 protein [Algoriphagus machipongonensis]EAZ82532.1 glycosyl transferase [Algoriphagus machipongonensis]
MNTSILILSPFLSISGGVSSYVLSLRGFWGINEKYFFRGGHGSNTLAKSYYFAKHFFNFLFKGLLGNPDAPVFINTSLNKNAYSRDLMYIKACRLFKRDFYIFIHGWDTSYFTTIKNHSSSDSFKFAKKIFVLSEDFKNDLVSIGIDEGKIEVEVTVVNSEFIDFFNINKSLFKGDSIKLLYLARLEKDKGIFRLLDAFKILSDNIPNLQLRIAGSGSAETEVTDWISSNSKLDISYIGRIDGTLKYEYFAWADYYVLPTSHGEGLPISVLEAITAGCVVIVPPVGGLKYFFKDQEMGFLLNDLSPSSLANVIIDSLKNVELLNSISNQNFKRGKSLYSPTVVVDRLKKHIYG